MNNNDRYKSIDMIILHIEVYEFSKKKKKV